MIHTTSFTVYPDDCNYMKVDGQPMVHGGTMMLRMDRAAAEAVKKCLVKSHVKNALTVAANVQFNEGAKLGDLIEIRCFLEKVGIKSLTIAVSCFRMNTDGSYDLMATGEFRFCTMALEKVEKPYGARQDQTHYVEELKSAPHGLKPR